VLDDEAQAFQLAQFHRWLNKIKLIVKYFKIDMTSRG
jgi:hypothetical protein